MTRDDFAQDVPRETLAQFDAYAALLVEWQGRMNLVGPATLPDVWSRHFDDSAQLVPLAAEGPWLDIGAGAGFPGLVAAILGAGPVHLVESTAKKCAFLHAVIEALGLGDRALVHQVRVEALPVFGVATIAARACAPLSRLFEWGQRFARPDTRWLLPKGATHAAEIASARLAWAFDYELVPSRTEPAARIVVATNVRRR